MDLAERQALLALTHVQNLGPVRLRLLLQHFGSAQAVLGASRSDLLHFPGIGPLIAERILAAWDDDRWREDLRLVEQYGVELVGLDHPSYPQRLRELPDAPILLYVKGDLSSLVSQSIAVVGTRQITRYGQEMAERVSAGLARNGWLVVSGLARGADTAAHVGALEEGKTVAVIGSGLSKLYPSENKQLARRIVENGAVISEFPMRTPPDRQNFPQRNRIVSGMSRAVLLIQAPAHSGAMLTMRRALQQGRDCFAIPGPVMGDAFRGNHNLIREGLATLVESAEDIVAHYGELFRAPIASAAPALQLEPEESALMQELGAEELTIEELLEKTRLPVIKLNVLLMSLILKKVVREFPGKIYKKVS